MGRSSSTVPAIRTWPKAGAEICSADIWRDCWRNRGGARTRFWRRVTRSCSTARPLTILRKPRPTGPLRTWHNGWEEYDLERLRTIRLLGLGRPHIAFIARMPLLLEQV